MTSWLLKKSPFENKSNFSVGGGLFHWRAFLTIYMAQMGGTNVECHGGKVHGGNMYEKP